MGDLIALVVLLAVGYGFGTWAEKKHYRSILQREEQYRTLHLIAKKRLPRFKVQPDSRLVSGSVVVSVDYFKRFIAGLRNLLGGRVTSYESLLDRARREAILRMKEEAAALGAAAIFNVKLETMSISKGQRNSVGAVEVLAYGTALFKRNPGA